LTIDVSTRLKNRESNRGEASFHLSLPLSFPAGEKEPQAGLAGLDWSLGLLKADGATRLEKKSGRAAGVKHLFISLSHFLSQLKKKEPQVGLVGLDWSLRLLKADGATRLEEKSGRATGVKHLFISLSHFPSPSAERLSHKQALLGLDGPFPGQNFLD
jgi:hypothetical protein